MILARNGRHALSAVRVRTVVFLLAAAVASALLILVWARVVSTVIVDIKRPPLTGRPTAIVWHGRVFLSQGQVEAAFRARGLQYSVWARQHPAAVAILTGRPLAVRASHRSPVKRAVTSSAKTGLRPRTGTSRRAVSQAVSGSGHGSGALASALLWALVLLLVAVAAAPKQLLRRASIRWLGLEQRTALAAAAGTLAVGLFVANWGP
jgi:hypothetical protein